NSQLQVQSTYGEVTVFWIDLDLPVLEDAAQSPSTLGHQKMIGIQSAPPTLLVVDDDATNRDLLAQLLEPLGFTLLKAKDGHQALELTLHQSPDLVFTDLFMPEVDGLEVIRQIRSHPELESLPIVVCSASVFEADRRKGLTAGANAFLAKPIVLEELLAILQDQLNIEWDYEEPSTKSGSKSGFELGSEQPTNRQLSSEMTPPPPDLLSELNYMATIGDIYSIEAWADDILNQPHQPELIQFAAAIKNFTSRFQLKQLQVFLNSFATETHRV
ncbi:MAG: response regulator, partial [Leptolyngbyaceae cyanobacterium]